MPSNARKRHGRKPVGKMIQEAAAAYAGGTREEIQWLIAEWEEDINRHPNVRAVDVEEWKVLVPDL
ncbi:Hypothetical predicted protein, partial [Olea europaea subsp. europaea]